MRPRHFLLCLPVLIAVALVMRIALKKDPFHGGWDHVDDIVHTVLHMDTREKFVGAAIYYDGTEWENIPYFQWVIFSATGKRGGRTPRG